MQLQTNPEAEGVFKRHGRQRTRKKHWREKWITLTNGAKLNARAIKQVGPKTNLVSGIYHRQVLFVPEQQEKLLPSPPFLGPFDRHRKQGSKINLLNPKIQKWRASSLPRKHDYKDMQIAFQGVFYRETMHRTQYRRGRNKINLLNTKITL